jgi:hypothetical protein
VYAILYRHYNVRNTLPSICCTLYSTVTVLYTSLYRNYALHYTIPLKCSTIFCIVVVNTIFLFIKHRQCNSFALVIFYLFPLIPLKYLFLFIFRSLLYFLIRSWFFFGFVHYSTLQKTQKEGKHLLCTLSLKVRLNTLRFLARTFILL